MEGAERFIREWEAFSSMTVPKGSTMQVIAKRTGALDHPKVVNPKKDEVAQAVAEILLANKTPMTRDELLTMLARRGMGTRGKNPAVVLQTMLWRMQSVIVHLKGYGYWPTNEPYESAGYEPEGRSDDAPTEADAGDAEGVGEEGANGPTDDPLRLV